LGTAQKQTKIVTKRTKLAKKTSTEIPILRTTSGGGAEKDNNSAETEKNCNDTTKIQSAEKVPKRVATVSSSKRTTPLTLDTLKIKIRREKKSYSRKKAKNGVFSKQKITGAYIEFLFFLALTL
jgi:hypothetical protein